MENLLNALSFADQVCKEATPHLANAQALRQQNAEQKAGKIKTAKIIGDYSIKGDFEFLR